ncbi:hypothetical protein N0V82_005994 [Gnomoniopsis sp. IMI 355080]|nr:hypothetical protein N0V82_005994 [Gnomoniopsis sp. IMI 355080]
MHILIIGGSGRTGELVIDKAISHGHQVTALVRKPASLKPRNNLTIVEGTPINPEDLDKAFTTGADKASVAPNAVVVTLNARRVSDSPFAAPSPDTPARLMADSTANTIAAMKRYNVSKIVIMSSMGTGSSYDGLNFLMRLVFSKTNMKFQMVDHNAVDSETRRAGVEFVLVRPAMLAEGPEAEVKVYPDDGKGIGFMPRITRHSVAGFIVRALEGSEFVGRAPVISN